MRGKSVVNIADRLGVPADLLIVLAFVSERGGDPPAGAITRLLVQHSLVDEVEAFDPTTGRMFSLPVISPHGRALVQRARDLGL